MLLTHKLRKSLLEYYYLETFLLMFIYVVIGYAIDPDDVLMIDKDFSFLSIILAIITLFHGISSGIFAMLIFAIVMKYFYIDLNIFTILKSLY